MCLRNEFTDHVKGVSGVIALTTRPFAQSKFLEYHASSSDTMRCHIPSRVTVWFNDSAGDIDFNQMFLSQSETTTLHESMILR